jgi:hypothetical protein
MENDFPYIEVQEAWLTDLETTTERQAVGVLHAPSGFCCLGRACVVTKWPTVLGPDGARQWMEKTWYEDPGEMPASTVLPQALRDRLKLRTQGGGFYLSRVTDEWKEQIGDVSSLYALNDRLNWPFRKIAAFIRANPTAVFSNLDDEPC